MAVVDNGGNTKGLAALYGKVKGWILEPLRFSGTDAEHP